MGACFLYGKTGNGASGKKVPKFTYTGDYKIEDGETENWKVRFLTGGTLVFKSTPPAIDVFCVGGGAGGQRNEDSGYDPCRPGGGGGYTKTTKNVAVKKGESYQIVIGAGGAGLDYVKGGSYGNNGGATTAFGCTAKGGYAAYAGLGLLPGGNGGSGGGGAGGAGGSNGGNGVGSKTTDAGRNSRPHHFPDSAAADGALSGPATRIATGYAPCRPKGGYWPTPTGFARSSRSPTRLKPAFRGAAFRSLPARSEDEAAAGSDCPRSDAPKADWARHDAIGYWHRLRDTIPHRTRDRTRR